MNNSSSGTAAGTGSTLYVRALYDYEADDRTSLSFQEGDVIQVITQLESGWWDGVINGVRGWFPSNYCETISTVDEDGREETINGGFMEAAVHLEVQALHEDQVLYEEEDGEEEDHRHDDAQFDDTDGSDKDDSNELAIEGTNPMPTSGRADFWIPQATPDGRLFYYNTMTGESSMELPMESPTSANESGPRDRMHVSLPDRTRLPPEMLARGLTQEEGEGESDRSASSDGDTETAAMNTMAAVSQQRNRGYAKDGVGISPARSLDSMSGSLSIPRLRTDAYINTNLPVMTGVGVTPTLASATSFTGGPTAIPEATPIPRSFFDDGTIPPLTWDLLKASMKHAVDQYRDAINNGRRAEYVARAEDISDHLRLLLAAGSGTTDNHSGQPSIISTNKALYPHFRDMMSKFSKLVISSHIASADWPNAESVQKCLQEAEGVRCGVYSFVDVARQQRGDDIPRLFPGFAVGSMKGGSWQNNALGPRDPITCNFLDDEEAVMEPTAILDARLLQRLDEQKRLLVSSVRELEKYLDVTDKIVTPFKHEVLGNNVCSAGGKVLESFKNWIAMIESIDLSSLENMFQAPQVTDFGTYKQSLYDNMSDLVLGCQAVAGPLADEWAEVRGEPLENRLEYVRQCARALETNSSNIGFSLQLLSEQVQINLLQLQQQAEARLRNDKQQHDESWMGDSVSYGTGHMRPDAHSTAAGIRPPHGYSEVGEAATNNYRKGDLSKVRKILGDDPTPQGSLQMAEDVPPFLRLDLEHELSWDLKSTPMSLKGGTLPALMEQLTRHDKLDSNFNNTFLLTYKSFTTARELFEHLIRRFNIQPPEGLSAADFETWRERKQKPIRFRVVNILKSWFEQYWLGDPVEETKQLIRDIYAFTRDAIKSSETPGSASLMALLDQRLNDRDIASTKRMIQTYANNVPAPIMPKNMKKLKFLDIDVTEFARQLTIIESKLYGKIKSFECLNKTWQNKPGPGEPEPAPNVKALILHSNQLTNWVAEMILAQMDSRKRVVVIKHFVMVAEKCRQLNNFSTMTSIISALGTAPIARLKRTWDQVDKRTQAILEVMRHLMSSTKNFNDYRDALHAANPPCIPFFGVYLTDLVFIEDGIPALVKKTDHINFAKRAKTTEVIRDIKQYQNAPYSLHPVPELQDYILSNMQAAGNVHEMYDKSLLIEPREREDEKIVRYVEMRMQQMAAMQGQLYYG